MESDGTPGHENCADWCDSNSSCGAFAVSGNTCYFKSQACGSDLRNAGSTDLYMKRGNNTMGFS